MSTGLHDPRPPWRTPIEYNDPPEPERADRPHDVVDAEPDPRSEFGVDDDDELDDLDDDGADYPTVG